MPIGTRNMVIMSNDIKMKNWMNYSGEEDVHEFFRVMVNYFCINLSSLLDCSSYFLFCGWMFVWLCEFDMTNEFIFGWLEFVENRKLYGENSKIIAVDIYIYICILTGFASEFRTYFKLVFHWNLVSKLKKYPVDQFDVGGFFLISC